MPNIAASTTHSVINIPFYSQKFRKIVPVRTFGFLQPLCCGSPQRTKVHTFLACWGTKHIRKVRHDGLQVLNRSSNEDSTASIDEPLYDTGLIEELEKVEVAEPEVEQRAENAAIYVGAAVAFGAAVWLVLGRTKAEGM